MQRGAAKAWVKRGPSECFKHMIMSLLCLHKFTSLGFSLRGNKSSHLLKAYHVPGIFSVLSPILQDPPLPGKLGSPLHPQSPALCQHITRAQGSCVESVDSPCYTTGNQLRLWTLFLY